MKVKIVKDHRGDDGFIAAGTEEQPNIKEIDDERAKQLIKNGIAEEVKDGGKGADAEVESAKAKTEAAAAEAKAKAEAKARAAPDNKMAVDPLNKGGPGDGQPGGITRTSAGR